MHTRERINELKEKGFCILREHLASSLVNACREAFWPTLLDYLQNHCEKPNRGPHRHFVPMPFEPPCFAPEFFFDSEILNILYGVMGDKIVADQWGCDVPVKGSEHQNPHVDYQRPLFPEVPNLQLPTYVMVVSFGLLPITPACGPIEIAPGTQHMPGTEALQAIESGKIEMLSVPLDIGDVLIRHPWALHRGTPNTTSTPRALTTVRYVRRWYSDNSRETNVFPRRVWQSLSPEQQTLLRFPISD
jgi:Phytanoyl-CoA dioxygenase (PhyH)